MTQPAATMFPSLVTLRGGQQARQLELGDYLFDYVAGGPDLVISFESAWDKINRNDKLRDPWALSFLVRQNYSVLGIKSRTLHWYRNPAFHAWFRAPALQEFLDNFNRVIFFGTSMGGHAALLYSQIRPGSLVVASNPQFTLNPMLVPWEHRFQEGQKQDWSGDFANTRTAARLADKIYLTYDPFEASDSRHIAMLDPENLVHLKAPFMGHATPIPLQQLGLLEETTKASLDGTLTSEAFAKLIRKRRGLARYYINGATVPTRPGFRDAMLAEGLAVHPDDPALLLRAVERYFEQGRFALCVELYDTRLLAASRLPPAAQGQLRALAGLAMCRLNLPGARIEPLVESVDEASRNARELVLSARFLNRAGAHQAAMRVAARAVRIAPKSEMAKNQLAIAEEAVSLHP